VFGFLMFRALTAGESVPDIQLEVLGVSGVGNGYVVEFVARNEGGTAAREIIVEGRLLVQQGPDETAQATISYAPPKSQTEGGLYFLNDPRNGTLELRALGYTRP
jgi:uncharacterized protein (TIGR02588 family)